MELFIYLKKLQKHLLDDFMDVLVLIFSYTWITSSFPKNQNLNRYKPIRICTLINKKIIVILGIFVQVLGLYSREKQQNFVKKRPER